MTDEFDKTYEGEILPPENPKRRRHGTARKAREAESQPQQSAPVQPAVSSGWGVPLLAGVAASGLAFLSPSLANPDLPTHIVTTGLVGVGTTLCVRRKAAAAIAAGYLACEYAWATAETVGSYGGAIGGAVAGAAIGYMVNQYSSRGPSFKAPIAGSALGGVTGYFAGGLGTALSVVVASFLVGGMFGSRKNILGVAAAAAIGYFGTTTFLKENFLPPPALSVPLAPPKLIP